MISPSWCWRLAKASCVCILVRSYSLSLARDVITACPYMSNKTTAGPVRKCCADFLLFKEFKKKKIVCFNSVFKPQHGSWWVAVGYILVKECWDFKRSTGILGPGFAVSAVGGFCVIECVWFRCGNSLHRTHTSVWGGCLHTLAEICLGADLWSNSW